ncbi:protein phosphatase [Weizmannia acidilactici]|uniref:protein-serine/threonine phosphatase n=1 Tax=Weizmannia acidilactici TaxID=2607726 RepID=A0A5J4J646_9BACI|nr:Stp1/IreP family PP2C-type Ser/Thr phosphatase [Weizmannia acidilactici]GER65577.1 protein phosphatase [Weizmannia acidilactici]GER70412.1 protein phosphatase [Weizmannia acidilactici]GER71934.1 protein phosphatase [Weizmannia acidilactici]
MESVYKTDKGRVRQHNEDSGGIFKNAEGDRLAVVADGMGGHRAGDIASGMAVQYFKEEFEKIGPIADAETAEAWLSETIRDVNTRLFEHAANHPECEGMGTTLVAAVCTNRFISIANIGDSRGYIFNENGFQQLTEDHSLVNELVKTGQISKEDAENHPHKNVILKALGTEAAISPDLKTIVFEENDYLLLCSDGLSNKVPTEVMKEVLEKDLPLERKAEMLVNAANENGGEDNITIALMAFGRNEGGCG